MTSRRWMSHYGSARRAARNQNAGTGTILRRPPRAVMREARSGDPRVRPGNVDRRRPSADALAHAAHPDDAWRARQQAGVAALMAVATQLTLGVSDTATAPVTAGWPGVAEKAPPGVRDRRPPRDEAESREGLRGRLAQLWADRLVRNSLYLMLSSAIQAALGFIFWVL